MKIDACAKINWSLDITGVREDGYHLMDMLMQPVSLADEITILPAEKISLTVSGRPLIRADEKNLVWRAADLLRQKFRPDAGCSLHVHKRIPVGAGMGGGSADAAAVLYGLNRLWELGLSQEQLEELGLSLGADVPFCLRGGLTRVTGIGEQIREIPCSRFYWLVVIQPCHGLSTGEVFTAYHAAPASPVSDIDTVSDILENGRTDALPGSLFNVLQPVSCSMQPEIGNAIDALKENHALDAVMTGSGSAVFGVFINAAAARKALGVLSQRWNRIWMCHTDTVSVRIHEP